MAAIRPNDPDYPGPFKITVKRGGQRWYWTRDTWKGAQKVAGLAEDDLDNGRDPYARYEVVRTAVPLGLTVAQWAPTWLAAQDLDRRVRASYGQLIDHDIIPEFGHLQVDKVRHIAAQAWLTRLRREIRPATGRPLSARRVRAIFGTFSRMMEAARLEGLIERNPCEGLKPPKVPKRPTVRPGNVLTPAQVVAVSRELMRPRRLPGGRPGPGKKPRLGVTDRYQRYADLTLVHGWTGCRPEETAGLRRNPREVQLLRRPAPAIVVVEPIKRGPKLVADPRGAKTELYHGDPKSEAGGRAIEIIQPIADLLARRMADQRPYVFGTPHGTPYETDDFNVVFKKAAAALGHPEWTVYDLRHSAASWADQLGWPRAALKERLGHAPEDVTDGYQHASPVDRARILVDLQRLWDEAWAAAEAGGEIQEAGGA